MSALSEDFSNFPSNLVADQNGYLLAKPPMRPLNYIGKIVLWYRNERSRWQQIAIDAFAFLGLLALTFTVIGLYFAFKCIKEYRLQDNESRSEAFAQTINSHIKQSSQQRKRIQELSERYIENHQNCLEL